MNNLSTLEYILVTLIIAVQTVLAWRTFRQIQGFKELIPRQEFFKVRRLRIPFADLQNLGSTTLLQKIASANKGRSDQKTRLRPVAGDDTPLSYPADLTQETQASLADITLVNPNEITNPIFDTILSAINTYLLKNKGAVTDFHLIKDIVERHVDAEDEDISQFANVPLYLGLMGTMLGIVCGLINLYLVSNLASGEIEIRSFLGAVSIAMFASLWGLFCTVANASFAYKTARRTIEHHKNIFYTFIQTELLPVLEQSITGSIYSLHQNLSRFNDDFKGNLSQLSGLLNKNHDALIAQERILQALDKVNAKEFAEANIAILEKLQKSTAKLDTFNKYLSMLEYYVSSTKELSGSFEKLLTHTNNFENLAQKLDSRIDESSQLVQFLSNHFEVFETREAMTADAIRRIEDVMIKSLKQLEEHTQVKIEAIKEITIKEEDMMSKALADNRNNLSKLSLLDEVVKKIDLFGTGTNIHLDNLNQAIGTQNSVLQNINLHLNTSQINSKNRGLIKRAKNWWTQKIAVKK